MTANSDPSATAARHPSTGAQDGGASKTVSTRLARAALWAEPKRERFVVRLFDARSRGVTAGRVAWLKSPADARGFAKTRDRAFQFETRAQALRSSELLPSIYHPMIEVADV